MGHPKQDCVESSTKFKFGNFSDFRKPVTYLTSNILASQWEVSYIFNVLVGRQAS